MLIFVMAIDSLIVFTNIEHLGDWLIDTLYRNMHSSGVIDVFRE